MEKKQEHKESKETKKSNKEVKSKIAQYSMYSYKNHPKDIQDNLEIIVKNLHYLSPVQFLVFDPREALKISSAKTAIISKGLHFGASLGTGTYKDPFHFNVDYNGITYHIYVGLTNDKKAPFTPVFVTDMRLPYDYLSYYGIDSYMLYNLHGDKTPNEYIEIYKSYITS